MEPDETRRILTPPGTWTELPYLEHQHQSEVLVAPVVVLKKKFIKKTTPPSLNVPSTIGRGSNEYNQHAPQDNTNVTYAVSAVANCNCSASRNKRGGAKLRSMYACLYSSISQLNTVLMDKSTLCKCLAITSKQKLVVILLVLVFKTSHTHTKIHVRIHATFQVIRACMFRMLSVLGRYTTSTTNMYNTSRT